LACVPFIVANRRNKYGSNSGSIVVAIIFFLVIGLLFFVFFNNFNGFTIRPIWTIISGLGGFLIFISVIGIIAASISAHPKKYNEEPIKLNQYQTQAEKQTNQLNPYKVRRASLELKNTEFNEPINAKIPAFKEINFCRYCGAKKERDSIFCHLCGSKF
jgi:hypothetical protein